VIWLIAIGLALVALIIGTYLPRRWQDTRTPDLGWMSPQWLHEYRARSRSG
jgi:uncharacterized membrane protein YedE/YeeE